PGCAVLPAFAGQQFAGAGGGSARSPVPAEHCRIGGAHAQGSGVLPAHRLPGGCGRTHHGSRRFPGRMTPMATRLLKTPIIDPRHTCFDLEIRSSSIHRYGVYARERIPARRKVIEYTGERIARLESRRRGCGRHTYLFKLDDYWAIDGAVGGSGAEIIN